MDRCWQSFLRRFDLEHTFRLFKQVLGWTAPKIRDPAAADRWTWLIIACHAQLRLARPLAADLRRPWERPAPPGRLTPARVRRGFRNIRAKAARPPVRRNPASPAPDGRPDRRTATRRPATTWEKRRRGNSRSRHDANAQVKRQAESVIDGIAHALQLDDAERAHLLALIRTAGRARRPRRRTARSKSGRRSSASSTR